jgi:hypothetical protein
LQCSCQRNPVGSVVLDCSGGVALQCLKHHHRRFACTCGVRFSVFTELTHHVLWPSPASVTGAFTHPHIYILAHGQPSTRPITFRTWEKKCRYMNTRMPAPPAVRPLTHTRTHASAQRHPHVHMSWCSAAAASPELYVSADLKTVEVRHSLFVHPVFFTHSSVSASSAIDRVRTTTTILMLRTTTTTVRHESMRISLGWVWGLRDCLDRTSAHVLSVDSSCLFVLSLYFFEKPSQFFSPTRSFTHSFTDVIARTH